MNIVVDTSIIIAVIANEPQRDTIIASTRAVDIIAPPSVHWEISNAFSAMLKRNRITLSQALDAIEIYQDIPIRFVDVELDASLTLAAQLNIYAYDAYLIRCAQKYKSPLITLDTNLALAAQKVNIDVTKVR